VRRSVVVSVIAGVILFVPGSITGATEPVPAATFTPHFERERVWNPATDDWEPAIAAAPNSPWIYHLTTRYGGPRACERCPDPAIVLRASSDFGRTWGRDRFVCTCPGFRGQNDPQIEVAQDGTVYVVWIHGYVPGVTFSKSSDHGRTWTEPIEVATSLSFSDKPILAISRSGRHVYIAFNASDSYFVASHDYGRTFSEPVRSNDDNRYYFAGGGAVARDGTVYFAEQAYHQNSKGTVELYVITSTDGGRSWTQHLVDVSEEQPPCHFFGCPLYYFGPQDALAVDSAKTLMVAYNATFATRTPQELYVRTSDDRGETWSDRILVSPDRPRVNAAFPAIAAGPHPGDFRVLWQDNRNGRRAWNTWYLRTTDGGLTWGPTARLSDRPNGAPYKSRAGYEFPYGDYFEVAVDRSGVNHVIWGEAPHYVGPGGSWYTRGV
jgi:hypothetical protein